MDRLLELWTLYAHPRDYPDSYVVRQFVVLDDGKLWMNPARPIIEEKTLEAAREKLRQLLPNGIPIPRDTNDEPQIVETWI